MQAVNSRCCPKPKDVEFREIEITENLQIEKTETTESLTVLVCN